MREEGTITGQWRGVGWSGTRRGKKTVHMMKNDIYHLRRMMDTWEESAVHGKHIKAHRRAVDGM